MRVLDMRLIAFVTLILLAAAMPGHCAELPFAQHPSRFDWQAAHARPPNHRHVIGACCS